MHRVPGKRTPDASNKRSPFAMLTSLNKHYSPTSVPRLYKTYKGFVGDPDRPAVPIFLTEQQHQSDAEQYESGLMLTNQHEGERFVAQYDATLSALKGIERPVFAKQRKLGMKNNGQHGPNAARKIYSEEVGTALLKLVDHPVLRVLEEYKYRDKEKTGKINEIDDIFDMINMALATGVEGYTKEAKERDPKCNPMVTGACLDGGKSFIRFFAIDPGEVLHAVGIVDTGRLYPPHSGLTLFSNATKNGADESQDIFIPIPAFRILLIKLIDLRNDRVLFQWEPEDPDNEPFYKPDNQDIMVLIKQAQVKQAERIRLNRQEGAKKAAETRKRKKLEAAGIIDLVKSDSSSSDEPPAKRQRVEVVE